MSRVITVLLMLLVAASHAMAAAPATIGYQGLLTDAAGNPIPDASYSVTFSIHSTETGTTLKWSEPRNITTEDGLFSVILGEANPIPDSAFADTAVYLEIKVGSDPALVPRTRLSGTPHSFVSRAMDGPGPVVLRKEDASSGEYGEIAAAIDNASIGRVKVQFHWEASDPSSGASTTWQRLMHVDSGYASNVDVANSRATVESRETGHAHGHLDYLKKVGDAATDDSALVHENLSVDSGFIQTRHITSGDAATTVAKSTNHLFFQGKLKVSQLSDATTRDVYCDSDSTLETSRLTKTNLFGTIQQGISQQREHIFLSRQVGDPSVADTVTLELESNDSTASSAVTFASADGIWNLAETKATKSSAIGTLRTIATAQNGYHTSVGTDTLRAFLSLEGVNSDGSARTITESINQTTHASVSVSHHGTDTSGIETVVSDTAEWLALTTTTGGTRYGNITLKRGSTGSLVEVSHVGATSSDGVFVSSNAAAGGAVGINTSSPSLAFHLVGSGCYTGTFGACSDRRYKRSIETLSGPLSTLNKLRGVSYEWKHDEYPERSFPDGKQVGVIAQEVEEILPSLVTTDADGYKSVDYSRLTPVLIEAVKEQQRQIESQQAQIHELKAMVQQLVARQRSGNAEYGLK